MNRLFMILLVLICTQVRSEEAKTRIQNLLAVHQTVTDKYQVLRQKVIQGIELLNQARETENRCKAHIESLNNQRSNIVRSESQEAQAYSYYMNTSYWYYRPYWYDYTSVYRSYSYSYRLDNLDNDINRVRRLQEKQSAIINEFYGSKLETYIIPPPEKGISQGKSAGDYVYLLNNLKSDHYVGLGGILLDLHTCLASLALDYPDYAAEISLALEKSRPLLTGERVKSNKVLVLKDGREIPISMIIESNGILTVRTQDGKLFEISRDKVLEVKQLQK